MNRLTAILIFLLSAAIFAEAQKAELNSQNPATPQANMGQTSAPSASPSSTANGNTTLAVPAAPGAADDAGLQGRIQQALNNEPTLAGGRVSVNVTDSAIELSGTVASGKDKLSAERIAQSFDNNRKFEDKLMVTGQNPTAHIPQQK